MSGPHGWTVSKPLALLYCRTSRTLTPCSIMNIQDDPTRLAYLKFAVGQPVPRSEDPILLRGARPLYRRRQPRRPGLCGDGAQHACRTASSAASTSPPRGRCRACWPSIPAPICRRRLWRDAACRSPLKNRDGSDDDQAGAAGAGRSTRCATSAIRSPASSRKPQRRPRTRPRRSSSTSSRCRR